MMISEFDEVNFVSKIEVIAHRLLQHSGQGKEIPENHLNDGKTVTTGKALFFYRTEYPRL